MILESCKFGHAQRWVLHGAVVMPDHVHMLLTPQIIEWIAPAVRRTPNLDLAGGAPDSRREPNREPRWISLAEIVKSIKSFTARKINVRRGRKSGAIWQDEYYDREVRDEADFKVKIQYMMNNPVKLGLVKQAAEWDGLWLARV
jgi:REP element-mobilizing transposase RayT